jgi:hypothetical protein
MQFYHRRSMSTRFKPQIKKCGIWFNIPYRGDFLSFLFRLHEDFFTYESAVEFIEEHKKKRENSSKKAVYLYPEDEATKKNLLTL